MRLLVVRIMRTTCVCIRMMMLSVLMGQRFCFCWHFLALQITTLLAHSCCVISIMLMSLRWLKRNLNMVLNK